MNQIVNIDGELYEPENAKISVFDHGFLFGDSIYETMRTYGRKIFLIDRHMQRLQNSANMIRLKPPLSVEGITKELMRTVEATSNQECYVRLIVTRGKGKIGLDIELSKRSSYVMIVSPFEELPAAFYEKGIKVALVAIRRNDQLSLSPRMKTCNLLNNVLAYSQAKEQSAFEGILCNLAGYVTEATGSNVFIVKGGMLLTPSPEAGLLEGITRGLTLELAAQEQIPIAERNIRPDEMLRAEECFITGTTKGILPVAQISETLLPRTPGPVTFRLMQAYKKFVELLDLKS